MQPPSGCLGERPHEHLGHISHPDTVADLLAIAVHLDGPPLEGGVDE